jgi:hypothetical protein
LSKTILIVVGDFFRHCRSGGKVVYDKSMAREESRDLAMRPHPRHGEGVIIETARRMVPLPNGSSSFELVLDFGKAPVPERKYVANVGSVTYEKDEALYLIFGQRTVAGRTRELRTIIEVAVSSVGALMFLRSLESIREQLKVLDRQIGHVDGLSDVAQEVPGPQTATLAANQIVIAFSGREAVMDFYHASPFVLSQLNNNGKFAVDPVVRVILPSRLLLTVISKVEEYKKEFPKEEVEALSGADREVVQTSEVRYGKIIR